ncbi:MAG: hypothetical protein R3Y35_07310 [Clostridia bacterium]
MTNDEKKYLRELATEFKEASETKINCDKRQAWYDLNDLKDGVKPLFINHYWPTAMAEIFPKEIYKCTSEDALNFEQYFLTKLFYVKDLCDDNVVEPLVYSPYEHFLDPYPKMQRQIHRSMSDHGSGAFEIVPTIINTDDICKITSPSLEYDHDLAKRTFEETNELFSGILTTIKKPVYFAAKISDEYSWYRGIEQTYMDLYDEDEWMHEVLKKIADNFNERFDMLEEVGLLGCLDLSDPLGSAGLRYISGMKDYRDIKNGNYFADKSTTKDNWGFSCSEVFSCVSNAMHDEFSFKYDVDAMDRFFACNVGCCEVLDKKIDLIRQFKNAVKISVSEWCDHELAASKIKHDFVYSYRAAGTHFLSEHFDKINGEKEIRSVIEASKRHNCNTEIVLNIGGEFGSNPREKAKEWSKMTRYLIDEYYSK